MSRTIPVTKTQMALWALIFGYLVFLYGPSLYTSALSSDLAILISFAERILDGMKLSQGYYDPNPPMSMLIYVPVVWIARYFGFEIYHVHFFYTVFITGISFGLSAFLLRKLEFIHSDLRQILMMSTLAGLFIIPSIHFGDRDHLIICGLLPLTLLQICYLQNIAVPRALAIPALLLGTLAVLIKPHYGILPAALLLWRFIKTRDLKIVFQADFLFLAGGVTAYIAMVFFFFSDYLFVVLPDVLSLYAPIRHPIIWKEFSAYSMILLLFILAAYESRQDKGQKNVVYTLSLFCFLMLVVFVVQGKGLNYHRIPYLVFFYMGLAATIYLFSKRFIQNQFSVLVSVLICLFALLSFRGLPNPKITHDGFKALPISQALEKHCPKNNETCRYFFYHDTSEIIHQLAIYHDAFHASRFTSLWFSPVIIINENRYADGKEDEATYSLEEVRNLKSRFVKMMVEDFKTMQPDILIVLGDEMYDNRPFDFFDYFSSDAAFAKMMQNYKKVDSLSFKREIYYPGMTTPFTGREADTIDIYKRQEN